jgi:hypothetical protein
MKRPELGGNRQIPLGLLARGNPGVQNHRYMRGGEELCLHGTVHLHFIGTVAGGRRPDLCGGTYFSTGLKQSVFG